MPTTEDVTQAVQQGFPYAIENTDKLCADVKSKWQEIRENLPEDQKEQTFEFDMCLVALLSRVTGITECISGGPLLTVRAKS